MDNERIINSIKALCKEKGITVGQLEKTVGLSQGLVSKWKDKTPSLDKIIDIADYFNVSLDEVIGRSNENEKSELVATLKNLTTMDAIKWTECTNQSIHHLYNNVELFEIHNSCYEIFSTQYKESTLFIVADYDEPCGMIESLECSLFIQPDIDSRPVLQVDENFKECEKLWLLVHTSLKGTPDEYKAAKVKQQIITSKDEIVFNNLPQYFEGVVGKKEEVDKLVSNNELKEKIVSIDLPELQQIIETFTNPNIIDALNTANTIAKYFNEIKKEKQSSATKMPTKSNKDS